MSAGDGDYGNAGEAEGCCVAEKTAAGLAVVCACWEDGDGCGGKKEEIVFGEELVHALAEGLVESAQNFYFRIGDARAPFEAFADGGLEMIEVAGVDAGGFPSLNGGEDIE
jgi:hypothetical protein